MKKARMIVNIAMTVVLLCVTQICIVHGQIGFFQGWHFSYKYSGFSAWKERTYANLLIEYIGYDVFQRVVCKVNELNDFLKDFGNCGYSVRPSQRRKGYATKMLELILERARHIGMDKLQLSVERSNEASVKTITKNGGKYERSFSFEGEKADVYMIRIV